MGKAIIFDFDGVIVDSESHWESALAHLYHAHVPGWTDEAFKRMKGMSVEREWEFLRKEFDIAFTAPEYAALLDEAVRDVYLERVAPMPGLVELLERLGRRNVPVGVATSSNRDWIMLAMRRFDLEKRFGAIVTSEDAPGRTKPAPDLYLLAAERLGVEPGRCVAMEDSSNGIAAAKAAGMRCIGLLGAWNTPEQLAQADERIESFDELDDDRLALLLG